MVHMNGRTASAMYMVNNTLLERYMTLVESLNEMQRRVKLAKRKSGSFLTQFTAGKQRISRRNQSLCLFVLSRDFRIYILDFFSDIEDYISNSIDFIQLE